MVFNSDGNFYLIVLIALFIWLGLVSFFLYRIISHYNRLTKDVGKGDLKAVLEKILTKSELSQEKISELSKKCQELEREDRLHIKKIGILRFNPFKDTGGNQSFVLAFLNEENSGLILSSLYNRTGSRWYIKKTENGKGKDLELSKEEEEAIKLAKV